MGGNGGTGSGRLVRRNRLARRVVAAVGAVVVSLGTVQVIGPMAAAAEDDLTVVAWGENEYGSSTVPAGLTGVTQVSAGGLHSLALKSDGTVVAWGADYSGQASVPAGLTGVSQVSAGGDHSLALKSDGTVVAWGANHYGQLSVPAGLTGVSQVSAGSGHSLALKRDGTVVAWGDNDFGQSTVPAGLIGVTQVSAGSSRVSAGSGHSLALKSDGTVVAWGWNFSGQASVPAGLTGVIQVSAGGDHSLALKSDGTVVAWGFNLEGQSAVPAGLTGVTQVSAGGSHSLAMKGDGTVVAWGWDYFGQTKVPAGLVGVTGVDAGYYHNLALVEEQPVHFTPVARTVAENAGTVYLTVTRDDTEGQLSGAYSRVSGTATPGKDFTFTPGTLDFAAGEATKTIPLTITDDIAMESRETIVVVLRDPASGWALASTTVTIAASDQRPDALISTRWVRGYIGNDIYNTTAVRQTKTLTARRTETRRFYVKISNDGTVRNTFAVKGSAARPGSVVKYYDSQGNNITAAMRSTTGWKLTLRPGTFRRVTVQIRVKPGAAIGSLKPARVTGKWVGDSVRKDVVKAVVKVTK
jgi:hypothetical protein